MRAGLRSATVALVCLAASLVGGAASARDDEKQACARASEEAQQLRSEGRPKEARDRLLVCARDTCPGIVRKDCTLWLAEVTAALPSVVVAAKDAQGQDVVTVKVTLDGEPFTDKVDGKAIAVNPGVHTFHFEMDGAPPVDDKVVVREGEKNRELLVTFKTPTAALPPKPAPPPVEPPPPPPAASHAPPALTYVFGGLAVVAAGGYAYFGIKGKSDVDNLRATCAPDCTASQKNNASTELLVANVSFGVGVAALVTAAIVWIAAPGASAAPKAGTSLGGDAQIAGLGGRRGSEGALVDVVPLKGGAGASVGWRF
jgi:hypothetical protein